MEKYLKKKDRAAEKKENPQQNLVTDLHDFVYLLAIVLVIYLLFFRVVVVVGDSMFDTLVNGDRIIIVSNLLYRNPKAGDVIVASKDSFRGGECIVKRIIATEGQKVDIDFETGTVYVDDVALTEDYTYSKATNSEGVSFPLIVEDGCFFVMGDNRIVSKDSRSPEIGLIDRREIMGKALFLLIPGNDEGTVATDFNRIGVIS